MTSHRRQVADRYRWMPTLAARDEAPRCIALLQKAGVHLLRRQLEQLGSRGRLLHTTTFTERSTALGMARELGAQVGILNRSSGTYHPKVYLARRGDEHRVVIGSANLTGQIVEPVAPVQDGRWVLGGDELGTHALA